MNTVSATALSGLSAAQSDLRTGAHNLANGGDDGFRRSLTQRSTVDGGGVTTALTRAAAPGHAMVDDGVGQLQAHQAFMANLAVFRTGDAVAGALVDARV